MPNSFSALMAGVCVERGNATFWCDDMEKTLRGTCEHSDIVAETRVWLGSGKVAHVRNS
jgi:hypothetical protein